MNNELAVVIKRLPDRPDGTLVLHLNNRNIPSDTDPVREGVVEWNGKWPYYTRPRCNGARSIVVGDEQRHRRFIVHVVGKSYYVHRDIKGKLSNDDMAEIIVRIVEQLGYVVDYRCVPKRQSKVIVEAFGVSRPEDTENDRLHEEYERDYPDEDREDDPRDWTYDD